MAANDSTACRCGRPAGRHDWLCHLWRHDNRRDPDQHAAMLWADGRKITFRQGLQDYCRQQAAQRESKQRFFNHMNREHHGQRVSEPDATSRPAIAKADADDCRLLLTPIEWECVFLIFGLDWTRARVANELGIHRNTLAKHIRRAIVKIYATMAKRHDSRELCPDRVHSG